MKLGQQVFEFNFRHDLIDDDPHGARRRVRADINNALGKSIAAQGGHGDQQIIL